MSNRNLILAAAGAAGEATDPNFNQTVLLLHGDGTNGAQNNTFLDSSTNNFTITRNGNTTQGTFSPFSLAAGEFSNFFTGAGTCLNVPYSTDFNFANDFSVECFAYVIDAGRSNDSIKAGVLIGAGTSGSTTDNWLISFVISGGVITTITFGYENANVVQATSLSISINAWHHFLACRTGTTVSIFVDGTRLATATSSTSFDANSGGNVQIGRDTFGGAFENFTRGYISNMRVIKGTQPYNAASTTITQPTAPLSSVTNTVLLTCQSNRFVDTNTQVTAKAVTTTGTPSVQPFSPFLPTAEYDASVNGGSGYFDGSGDYLASPSDSAFAFGTGDYTMECWIYPTVLDKRIIEFSAGGDNVEHTATGQLNYFNGTSSTTSSSGVISLNTWSHIAIVRSSGIVAGYVNGTSVLTQGTTPNTTSARVINIAGASNILFTGYISNFRVVKGTAVYTAAFTPPTAPLTAITNTELLCNFTNAGIFDNTGKNNLETVADAQIDTSVKKYGTGSMEFDGTGDYLLMPSNPNIDLRSGDFTIEGWINTNSNSTQQGIVTMWGSPETQFQLEINTSGKIVFAWAAHSTVSYLITGSTTISASTWYHIAVVRDGSTFTLYLNGTSDGSGTSSANATSVTTMYVGATSVSGSVSRAFTGYIDDLRITKGIARYTTTFTPPTAAFPNL
jgi:hypothetical protein